MRIGAHVSAVLGTIHGEDGDAVRERVVSDLDVPASAFAATDLVVTAGRVAGAHRVVRIESFADDSFHALYALDGDRLVPTARLVDGPTPFLRSLARPTESAGEVRDALDARERALVDRIEGASE